MKKSIVTAFFTALSIGAYAQGETSSNHLYWILGGVVVVVALVYYVLNQKKTERRKMQLDDRPQKEDLSVKSDKNDESETEQDEYDLDETADRDWLKLAQDAYEKEMYQEVADYCDTANELGSLKSLDDEQKGSFYYIWGESLFHISEHLYLDENFSSNGYFDLIQEASVKYRKAITFSRDKLDSYLACIRALKIFYSSDAKYMDEINEKYQKVVDLVSQPSAIYKEWGDFLYANAEKYDLKLLELAYENYKKAFPDVELKDLYPVFFKMDKISSLLFGSEVDEPLLLPTIDRLNKMIVSMKDTTDDYFTLSLAIFNKSVLDRNKYLDDNEILEFETILSKAMAQKDFNSYEEFAIIYIYLEDFDQAIYCFEKMIAEDPNAVEYIIKNPIFRGIYFYYEYDEFLKKYAPAGNLLDE